MPRNISICMKVRIEIGPGAVLVGDLGRCDRPFDGEARIIPAQAAFLGRFVELAHEVQNLGVVRECQEGMGETARHVHHASVLRG